MNPLGERISQPSLFPEETDPAAWEPCARLSDLAEGKGMAVQAGGETVALFLHEGQPAAIEARCPHAAAPLERGWLENGVVTCPLHRWKFEVRTGRCLTDPAKSIRRFRTRVDETGRIWVELGNRTENPDRPESNQIGLDENH